MEIRKDCSTVTGQILKSEQLSFVMAVAERGGCVASTADSSRNWNAVLSQERSWMLYWLSWAGLSRIYRMERKRKIMLTPPLPTYPPESNSFIQIPALYSSVLCPREVWFEQCKGALPTCVSWLQSPWSIQVVHNQKSPVSVLYGSRCALCYGGALYKLHPSSLYPNFQTYDGWWAHDSWQLICCSRNKNELKLFLQVRFSQGRITCQNFSIKHPVLTKKKITEKHCSDRFPD